MSQLTLLGCEVGQYSPTSRYSLGVWGELLVAESLTKKGYQVTHHAQGVHADLLVKNPNVGEIWRLEIKTARQAKDGKYRFTLCNKGTNHRADSTHVVLLAVTKIMSVYPFVVPISELMKQNQAVITSHPLDYGGKLAPYRTTLSKLLEVV